MISQSIILFAFFMYKREFFTTHFLVITTSTATNISSGTVQLPCFAFWSVQPKPLKLASMLILILKP